MTDTSVEPCPGCRVSPGQYHQDGCDHAVCPGCGAQLLMHGDDECPETDGPDRPALWHGIDPSVEVAQRLGWWTTVPGLDGPVEDHTRVTIAAALGQISWDRDSQRWQVHAIDETTLDRALTE